MIEPSTCDAGGEPGPHAGPAAPRPRGAVTLWIMITCLVSHFVDHHGANPLPGLVEGDPATLPANRSPPGVLARRAACRAPGD